jgi:2-methylcitrate dehydratase PrpD
MKLYPCCKGIHSFVDEAITLVNKYDIKPKNVQEITIFGYSQPTLSLPLEVKSHPPSAADSTLSIPWAVAAVVARGRAIMADFTEEAIKSRDILDMTGKIKVNMDKPTGQGEAASAKVEIKMKDGQTYRGQAASRPVDNIEALPFSIYEKKFRDCASYAAKQLPQKNLDEVVGLVRQLEQVNDIREITRLLS